MSQNVSTASFFWKMTLKPEDLTEVEKAVDFLNTLTPEQFNHVRLYASSEVAENEFSQSEDL